MSQAYTSKALLNMTGAVETKLRQERSLLWRAKNLYREFLGDSSWMPCGTVETPDDRWIFEPRMADTKPGSPTSQYGSNGLNTLGAEDGRVNGEQGLLSGAASQSSRTAQGEEDPRSQPVENDVKMTDTQNNGDEERGSNASQTKEPKAEEVDTTIGDVSAHPGEALANGGSASNAHPEQDQLARSEENGKSKANEAHAADNTGNTRMDTDHQSQTQDEDVDKDAEMANGSSPAPRRMTTRAQATTANSQEGSHSNRSVSPSNDPLNDLPAPHPLFLVPDSICPDANYGLPPNEAEETRRLLWSYIQKQEETVRGFEHMLENLLRANRMKEDVLEWCKAEGHLGEMSDGEDWYDREALGLADGEDLKKGADEDEVETVEDSRATGKRGRGRRQ